MTPHRWTELVAVNLDALAADHRPWIFAVSREEHPNGSVLLVYLPDPDFISNPGLRRVMVDDGPAWSLLVASRPAQLTRETDGATWKANVAVAVGIDDEPAAIATHPAEGWMFPDAADAHLLADVGLILTEFLHASASTTS